MGDANTPELDLFPYKYYSLGYLSTKFSALTNLHRNSLISHELTGDPNSGLSGIGPLMYRGPIHTRPIFKISGLLFVASAGAYSWGRQGTQEQGRLQLQPEKNNNTGKMAVITPFQVSQPQLGSYWGICLPFILCLVKPYCCFIPLWVPSLFPWRDLGKRLPNLD
jgi:hypothetical protein